MGELFADVMMRNTPIVGMSVWHATYNDRTQRDMLSAAVNALPKEYLRERIADEIRWLLTESEKLAERRNTALHSPLVFVIYADHYELMPMHFFGNPRAKKLAKKDLLKEFTWYRGCAAALAHYAELLHYALCFDNYALPDRPQLPSLGQSQTRTRPRRKTKTK
jgi:tRNA A-37 threonylcarbamoyl transferase component Bud32